MSERIELAPGCALIVEESTPNHWIACCDTLVILYLYGSSHADPQHVLTAQQALSRAIRRGGSAQMLVLFSPSLIKPPTAEVRRAIVESEHLSRRIDRGAAVILGTGFMSAIHRGAITGILAALGLPGTIRVTQSIREGVAHAFRGSAAAALALERVCAAREPATITA